MDKDSYYILSVLKKTTTPLSTSEISKEIFKTFNIKLSKKICQNYLWSYFRDSIVYNPENYTYSLKSLKFGIDNFNIKKVDQSYRSITMDVKGQEICIEYDRKLTVELLLKSIAVMNLKKINVNSSKDLIKEINQYIEIHHGTL